MPRKLTQEEVIAKFRAVHGDYYDYSKVEYIDSHKEVCIICPEHGEFWQRPSNHIYRKQGCSKCSGNAKKTTEQFIAEAKAAHGDKYDYSKVDYIGANEEVVIICPIHGEFTQSPSHHVNDKNGCPGCSGNKKKSTEEFIAEARAIHGDKYDYSKVEYINDETDVIIICPIHGDFPQRPRNHLLRKGCPKCAGRGRTQEEWVEIIKKKNPNVEILEEIVNTVTPVPCLCRVCGHRWEPMLHNLVNNEGCPKCANYGFLRHNQGNLYVMVDDLEVPTMMKVGVSIDAEKRKDQVIRSAKKAGASIPDLHVLKTWSGATENMHSSEKAMHKALSEYKINFPVKFDGCQEFFYYRPEVFELIEEHLKKLTIKE